MWKNRKHPGTKEARRVLYDHGRDLGTCGRCGTNQRRMHIHHKNSNPYDNNLTNLQVVCAACHRKIHGIIEEATDWIDEAEIDGDNGIIDDDFEVVDEKPDRNLISIRIEDLTLEQKESLFQQTTFPEPTQVIRPKHHYSRFLGYQCRQCMYFRVFKHQCDLWKEKVDELDHTCQKFTDRASKGE
jgi:hypothetical protein